MFDHHDPSVLWVSPDSLQDGDGTFDSPFKEVVRVAEKAKPGDTIVLKPGVYSSDVTFDISGTMKRPIRITAEQPGETEIRGACWFFYDVSDLIVTGLVFREAPHGAISVIGACTRNRFADLTFLDCGTDGATACTLFFGGTGGSCNVVENCRFERAAPALPESKEMLTIGLMVGDGAAESGEPIINHILRKNRIVNYQYGILVGSGDAPDTLSGHVVEYNTVEESGREAILVKCGDTTVRGNLILRSRQNSIGIGAGSGSVVEANRILDCASGIQVNGADHTVVNNCIVRCAGQAIAVRAASTNPPQHAAENLIVANNTCIDCGSTGPDRIAGIRIEPGTSCVIQKNLISGEGKPCSRTGEAGHGAELVVIADNIAANRCEPMDGVNACDIAFPGNDDFTNESGYGADGWMLKPEGFNPLLDSMDESDNYCTTEILEDSETEPAAESELPEDAQEQFHSLMEWFYPRENDQDSSEEA